MKNKLLTKILAVFMIIMVLFNGFIGGSIEVFADEEDKEEQRDNTLDLVSKDGNIFNTEEGESTDAKIAIMEKALEYDPRIQYLTTYAFLVDAFGVEGTYSNYNKIFGGNNTFSPLNLGIETDAERIYTRIVSDGDDSGNTHTTGNAGKDLNDKELDELIDKVTATTASITVGEMLKYYTPHNLGKFNEFKKKDYKFWNTLGDRFKGSEFSLIKTYYNFGEGSTKAKKGSGTVDTTELYNLVYAEIRKDVAKDVKRDAAKGLSVEGVINKKILEQVTRDYLSGIASKYRESKVGSIKYNSMDSTVKKESYLSITQKKKEWKWTTFSIGKTDKKGFETQLAFMPEYVKYNANTLGISESEVETFIGRKVQAATLTTLSKGNSVKNLKNLNESLKQHSNNLGQWRDKVKKDDRILGWIPIYPEISNSVREEGFTKDESVTEEQFKVFLEELEGTVYSSGKLELKSGKLRPLKINDLFYSEKSSPILTMGTDFRKNNYAKVKAGYLGTPSGGTSVGKFAGIRTDLENKWYTLSTKIKTKRYDDFEDGNYNTNIFRTLSANADKYNIGIDVERDAELGVDTYGNIIDAKSGVILIPYWQNEIMKTLKVNESSSKNKFWVSHAAYSQVDTAELVDGLLEDSSIEILENSVKESDVRNLFSEYVGTEDFYNKVKISDTASLVKLHAEDAGTNKELSNLALTIVAGTHKNVKAFNEAAIKWGKKSNQMYIATGVSGFSGFSSADDGGYTNDDLRERIMFHLDYGFADNIRLTLSSIFAYVYNSNITHAALTFIFYTTPISDYAIWDEVVKSLMIWLVGLMGVYIVYMAFQIFRNTITFKNFVQQFLIVSLIILIPTVIYSPLINTFINKPTEWIVGKQMQQLAILEYADELGRSTRERDPAYDNLFGTKIDLRDRSQDFIIEFYTDQHKNGFTVNDLDGTEGMGFADQIKSSRAEKTGKWGKTDLVKVNVSMFDLFNWVRARVDHGNDAITPTDDDLFTWLATSGETQGDYTEISTYNEYLYDPNIHIRKFGILAEGKENMEKVSASELFMRMYEASSDTVDGGEDLVRRLGDLVEIANAVKLNDPQNPIAMEEVEAIIRDLSFTRDARKAAYGYRDMGPSVELVPSIVAGKVGSTSTIPAISQKAKNAWERTTSTTLRVPNSDYLNMELVIGDLMPDLRDSRETPLQRYVYNINEQVLNDYINVHHLVRSSLGGASAGGNVRSSEMMIVTLNQFFKTNEELDIPMFPTKILPSTYSLDTYTRMVYVPVSEYKESEYKGLNNVGEYLALRENPIVLFGLFLPALLLLMVWGLIYFFVFTVLIMVVSIASFVWNYVIKVSRKGREDEGKSSKAWFNVLLVIGIMSVAKIGLLIIWYVLYYAMNEMMVLHGGLTYPYVVIHSVVIIAYTAIVLRYLIWNVLFKVMRDPFEAGGNNLYDVAFGRLGQGLKSIVTGGTAGAGGKGSPAATDSAIAARKKLEGAAGKLGKSALGGIGRGIKGATAAALTKGKSAGRAIGELGSVAAGRLKNNTSKYAKFDNPLMNRLRKGVVGDYENIDTDVGGQTGVSLEELERLGSSGVVGQVVTSTADGENVTIMSIGNKGMAESMRDQLKSKGLKAEVNKNNDVVFNSSGYDLESAHVRKNLFGELIDELQGDLEDTETIQIKKRKKKDGVNYTRNADGIVTVPVGDDGLYTNTLDTLMNSREFMDAFIVEGMPTKDANGTYNQGSVDIRVRDGVNVEEALEVIYGMDNGLRTTEGGSERKGMNFNEYLEYEGIENNQLVRNMAEKVGMKIQDGKILYHTGVTGHIAAAKEINNLISEEYEQEMEDKRVLMGKAIAYTARGGNAGFLSGTYNTAVNEEIGEQAGKAGILSDKVETVIHAGKDEKSVVDNIETYKSIGKLERDKHNDFAFRLENLYDMGSEIFTRGHDDDVKYDQGINAMIKSSTQAGVGTDVINKVKDEYEKLGSDRSNAVITGDEYKTKVAKLYNNFQTDLKESGDFSKVISQQITKGGNSKKSDKDVLDDFVTIKQDVEKEGVSSKVLEKLGTNIGNAGELINLVEGIDLVESNGEGVIKVATDSALTSADAARLIAQLSEKFDK